MKRVVFAVLVSLAVFLFCFSSFAEYDNPFENLTFDQLIYVRQYLDDYIFSRPEFKKVTVPEGIYKIGSDIPAGEYEIFSLPDSQTSVVYFDKLNELGSSHSDDAVYQWEVISDIDGLGAKSYHFTFADGNYVKISIGSAVFTTYIGPSFTFE